MSLGSELKQARETRKISLETVSEKTRIPIKYLESIEENRFDIFPSHTYAKGFIRAYAKVVGVDPQVLTRQFMAEVSPEEVKVEPLNAEVELEKTLGWRPTLSRSPVFRHSEGESNLNLEMVEEEYVDSADRRETYAARQRARSFRSQKWLKGLGQIVPTLMVLILLVAGAYYGVKALRRVNWGGSKPQAQVDLSKSYVPIKVADKYQHLILKALDKSWVLVTMDDGQSSSEADMDQGEVKTYKALKNFKLKLGNAGGVDVQFNGQPLGILGVQGQVVEISLPQGTETTDSTDQSTGDNNS